MCLVCWLTGAPEVSLVPEIAVGEHAEIETKRDTRRSCYAYNTICTSATTTCQRQSLSVSKAPPYTGHKAQPKQRCARLPERARESAGKPRHPKAPTSNTYTHTRTRTWSHQWGHRFESPFSNYEPSTSKPKTYETTECVGRASKFTPSREHRNTVC